jgi:hypothetical protein
MKHRRKLRKLWQETTDPACKSSVNWVIRNIRRMVRRTAHEIWETKLANCEVTPQAIRSIAKSLTKRVGPKAPSALHGPLGLILYPIDKTNMLAASLGNQFRAHDLGDCDHRQQVEATV